MNMKTSIRKRFFRFGWNAKSAIDNGWNAKHEAYYTRTRLNRMMDKHFEEGEYDGNNKG